LIIEILCKRELKNELSDKHIAFIKSIIDPKQHHSGALYQIVANNLNGIDVDKFDYLSRDTKNLGLSIGFNSNRLINEFIIDNNGNIAYPKHCSTDIYDMFHSRYMMHKKVYSHKTVKLIESMLVDLFLKIDPIFSITKSIDNMSIFCELTDDTIFQYIQYTMNPPFFIQINLNAEQYQSIKKANAIYQRITTRNLYQQIIEITDENAESYLCNFLEHFLNIYPSLKKNDFIIEKMKFGFISGNKADPFESIYFYDKKENNNTFTIKKNNISGLMNNKIQETHWHLICKKKSIYHIIITEAKNYMQSLPYNKEINNNVFISNL
jgi:deoxynucleoside triphosphate triphosphohydrolase SAMHD1